MQRTITSFKSIESDIMSAADLATTGEIDGCWEILEARVLLHKVKFPILEKVALTLEGRLSVNHIDHLLTKLGDARHISCYPVIGKLIQLRINENLSPIYDLAIAHIIQGNEWYACDIISERVFGEGSLQHFDTSYELLKKMGDHENLWIQRSIGIATHYATKKKLPKASVEKLFFLMLEHGHKTQLYIKKGIGWPAKTIGKFHPDLIHKHADKIRATKLSKWFLTKIRIGLSMAKAQPLVS